MASIAFQASEGDDGLVRLRPHYAGERFVEGEPEIYGDKSDRLRIWAGDKPSNMQLQDFGRIGPIATVISHSATEVVIKRKK